MFDSIRSLVSVDCKILWDRLVTCLWLLYIGIVSMDRGWNPSSSTSVSISHHFDTLSRFKTWNDIFSLLWGTHWLTILRDTISLIGWEGFKLIIFFLSYNCWQNGNESWNKKCYFHCWPRLVPWTFRTWQWGVLAGLCLPLMFVQHNRLSSVSWHLQFWRKFY